MDIEGLANVQRFVMATIAARSVTSDGGPGSGNHNHAGRPGQVGGSQPGGGKSNTAIISGPSAEASGSFYLDEKLRPKNDTYEDGETFEKWQQANMRGRDNPNRLALMEIFEEGGMEAVTQEYYNFKLQKNTKDLHQISEDEAHEVIYDNMSQSTYDGWIREANSNYKPRIVNAIVSSPEMRNATLNLMYENYKFFHPESEMSFEEFLETPVTMFRGGRGQKHVDDDVFSSYTFDKKIADKFAGENGKTYEAKIRPIDTYGSLNTTGESEILVPSVLAPNGNVDNSDLSGDGGPGSGNWGHTSMNRVGSKGGGSDPGGGRHMRLEKQMQPDGHYPWSEYHQREQKYTGLVWAYRANEVYEKSGKEAAAKFMGVSPESFSKKVEPKDPKQLVDRLNSTVSEEGRFATTDELRTVGNAISAEVSKRNAEAEEEYAKCQAKLDDMSDELAEFYKANGVEPVLDDRGKIDLWETLDKADKDIDTSVEERYADAWDAMRKAQRVLQEAEYYTTRDVLSEVRKMGTEGLDLNSLVKTEDSSLVAKVKEGIDFYPQDWIKSLSQGIKADKTDFFRPFYNDEDRTIYFASSTGYNQTIHELAHLFEDQGGLIRYEHSYYEERTKGEEAKWLGPGYGEDEKTKADHFVSVYMGKEYLDSSGNHEAYELLSEGFELLCTDPLRLKINDPDMYSWCLGILAAGQIN